MYKRTFDLILSIVLLLVSAGPMILLAIAIKLTSKGPVLHWSKRVGRNNKIFLMPKFRSMKIDTPQIATHLVKDPKQFLTPIGQFLRKSSLDELPQLLSVLTGDMSFVGPRPALFNQDDLVELRTQKSIENLRPGITGWAQINGRDELPIPVKVEFDEYYLKNQSLLLDLKIIIQTFFKVFRADGVSH
jgi:O-antigen biosynthesis protein WbqP